MGRRRQPIWDHYIAADDKGTKKHYKVKCRHCNHQLTGQAARMKRHVMQCKEITDKERSEVMEYNDSTTIPCMSSDCENEDGKSEPRGSSPEIAIVPSEPTHSTSIPLSSPTSIPSSSPTSIPSSSPTSIPQVLNDDKVSSVSTVASTQGTTSFYSSSKTMPSKTTNQTLSMEKSTNKDQKAIRKRKKENSLDEVIAKAFYSANIPFSAIENKHVIEMLKHMKESYTPPSKERLLDNLQCSDQSQKKRILLGCTGSVATVKIPELAVRLAEFMEVRIVATKSAKFFIDRAEKYNSSAWRAFQKANITMYNDEDEWNKWNEIGDPILHIELRQWADMMIIAPLSANTLGKLANGLCDNLITCIARAWDVSKPFIVAPAMNTHMWNHPLTSKQLEILTQMKTVVVPPAVKLLACGDQGQGALASVDQLVYIVQEKKNLIYFQTQ